MSKRQKVINAINKLRKINAATSETVEKDPVYIPSKEYEVTECMDTIKKLLEQPTYESLTITAEAWAKLLCYIHLIGSNEVTGFGRIVDNKVVDFKIIKQTVRSAYVECNEDAVLDFIMSTPAEERGQWILDWHSHVNMSTSPSGTDWGNYESMLAARMGNQFPVMIVNKRTEITAMQYISKHNTPDIDILIENKEIENEKLYDIYNTCKEEIVKLCTEAPKTGVYNNNRVGYNYNNAWQRYTGYNTNLWQKSTLDKKDNFDYLEDEYDDWEDDDDIRVAKAQGYVFENDKKIAEYCDECGKPLDMANQDERMWGVCSKCLSKVL